MKQEIKKKISVIIAAYNEESVIKDTVLRIVKVMSSQNKYDWELICVDDGSKDKTYVFMEEVGGGKSNIILCKHHRNFGQGRALRKGFESATGEIVVTLDADLSYAPEYIVLLADALEQHRVEVALASPYVKGGTVKNVPFYRHFLSRYGNKYLAKMSHYNISTSTCVVRAYSKEALDNLFLTSDGMELQLEILMKAAMMGFRVCEVPANLAWASDKALEAEFKRVSKMRIMRAISLYLLMGWLAKPALIFLILSGILLLVGSYMSCALVVRIFVAVQSHIGIGMLQAFSVGLHEVFKMYAYSFAISGGLIIFGFQMLAFALLTLQNKFYFEELYKMGLELHSVHEKR